MDFSSMNLKARVAPLLREVLQLQIVKLGTALAKCHFILFCRLTPFSKLLPLIPVGDRIQVCLNGCPYKGRKRSGH